jgi:hypothetical protein
MPVPGEDVGALVGDVQLDSVAVELGFVDPARAARRLSNRSCKRGLDKSGERALTPIAAGFFRWKATITNSKLQNGDSKPFRLNRSCGLKLLQR